MHIKSQLHGHQERCYEGHSPWRRTGQPSPDGGRRFPCSSLSERERERKVIGRKEKARRTSIMLLGVAAPTVALKVTATADALELARVTAVAETFGGRTGRGRSWGRSSAICLAHDRAVPKLLALVVHAGATEAPVAGAHAGLHRQRRGARQGCARGVADSAGGCRQRFV